MRRYYRFNKPISVLDEIHIVRDYVKSKITDPNVSVSAKVGFIEVLSFLDDREYSLFCNKKRDEAATSYIPLYDPVRRILNGTLLSPQQRDLFNILYSNIGKVVSYDRIFTMWWGGDPEGGPLTFQSIVKTHVCRIRKKLKGTEYTIRAIYREGIVLEKINLIDKK